MYYLVFILGIALSFQNNKKRSWSFIFFGVILTFLAFFRYGVGPDYFAYDFLYSRINTSVIQEILFGLDHQEVGFRVLSSFFKAIGVPYQIYLATLSGVTLYYIFKLCYKYSKMPTLSLFIYYSFYYFVWSYSAVRQGVTITVGIYYLLETLESKKYVNFFLITLLLTSIHTSAIILLPLLFIVSLKLTFKKLITIVLMSIIMVYFPYGYVIEQLHWLPFLSRILPYIGRSQSYGLINFQSLARIFFLCITLSHYQLLSKENNISKKIIEIYILSLSIYFIFKFSEITAARLSIYGKVLDILIFPNIYYLYNKGKYPKILSLVLSKIKSPSNNKIVKEKILQITYICMLILLCSLVFLKEVESMSSYAGLITNSPYVPYTHIFNKNSYQFDNRYFLNMIEE
ncbi:EpsG family protein [Alkalicella caledoniensis]|uniref:EpsG family protein n=1 Tax=Alkalicella caledoniensis TaxID=2731377 RepID=A0A7G9W406_ALKCA|nr:EpsG family protein [Alkalicella caledoniensis]QNO13418.1 EpsG family protein [Alkalicella caledoniensis]